MMKIYNFFKLKKFIAILLVFILIYTTCISANEDIKYSDKSNSTTNQSIDLLWSETVTVALKDELWDDLYMYDAANFLFIPMTYAYNAKDKDKINEFKTFFKEFFEKNYFIEPYENKNILNRLQFLYLAAEFLKYDIEFNFKNNISNTKNTEYLALIGKDINDLWLNIPAWQWEHDDFNGIKERLDWKIANKYVDKSYYRVFMDVEIFLCSIAADIKSIENNFGIISEYSEQFDDMIGYADYFFVNEIENEYGGGWLLQPGVWDDHPDYKYVGTETMPIEGETYEVEDIAWDTSHNHRMPAWIISLRDAYPNNRFRYEYYESLKIGLGEQFVNVVLDEIQVNDTVVIVTRNFMNGSNGYYRWKPKDSVGYGPYGLSGTITLGWWSLLENDGINEMYKNIYMQFPLNDDILKYYTEPNISNRERYKLFGDVEGYENGFKELIVAIASLDI